MAIDAVVVYECQVPLDCPCDPSVGKVLGKGEWSMFGKC